jgi:hypothetical protein
MVINFPGYPSEVTFSIGKDIKKESFPFTLKVN